MPLQATSGAASYDAFGGGVAAVPNYIEDVFSTWLYTGNGSTQTINNGIDLAGKGGLVWIKRRDAAGDHTLTDTARGASNVLYSNLTFAQSTDTQAGAYSYLPNGFDVYSASGFGTSNRTGATYASWTFREQPKFFDIVTFTSSASGNKTFSHNLGSVPGCVIIKNTQTADPWLVYHRSVGDNAYLSLNSTAAQDPLTGAFSATSTTFTISSSLMYNSQNYVAYLFAHNAGGFGLTGTDNVISCGSYVGTGSPLNVTLGYEPQWILVKRASTAGNDWILMDTMRGMSLTQASWLRPNTSGAETDSGVQCNPTATGFTITSTGTNLNAGGDTYIYIAIRRGPMKTPTTGTSVFSPVAWTGTGANATVTAPGFAPDVLLALQRPGGGQQMFDKLRGNVPWLRTSGTGAEDYTYTNMVTGYTNTGIQFGPDSGGYVNYSGLTYGHMFFQRAPGFFDEVCYTGTGSNDSKNHNLGVVPELVILKARNSAIAWYVMGDDVLGGAGRYLSLNTTAAYGTGATHQTWTSTTFSTGSLSDFNGSGTTYVAYLFATCAGVSKVGSYTGTGTTQTINCGFTAGSRFVMIKRTDSTGDWYVWDSARGIVAGNDPYLLLNSTAAEVTSTDFVDTAATGFELSSTAPAALNASGGTYIFLAIA